MTIGLLILIATIGAAAIDSDGSSEMESRPPSSRSLSYESPRSASEGTDPSLVHTSDTESRSPSTEESSARETSVEEEDESVARRDRARGDSDPQAEAASALPIDYPPECLFPCQSNGASNTATGSSSAIVRGRANADASSESSSIVVLRHVYRPSRRVRMQESESEESELEEMTPRARRAARRAREADQRASSE